MSITQSVLNSDAFGVSGEFFLPLSSTGSTEETALRTVAPSL